MTGDRKLEANLTKWLKLSPFAKIEKVVARLMARSRLKMFRELIGGVLQRGNFMKGRHPSATPWQKKIAQLSEKCQPFHHLRLSDLVRS